MVCGGAEAAICPLGISGFSAARALCDTFNDQPEKGSRPWDKEIWFCNGRRCWCFSFRGIKPCKKEMLKFMER